MFTEAERQIFSYHNGEKKVFADPFQLYRQILIRTQGKPNDLTEKVYIDSENAMPHELVESAQATETLLSIIREVFRMKPFSQDSSEGATDAECLAVYRRLAAELAQKKTPGEKSPISSAASAGPQGGESAATTSSSA